MFYLPSPKTSKPVLCLGIIEANGSRSFSLDLCLDEDTNDQVDLKITFFSLCLSFLSDRLDKLDWHFIKNI